jgi:hypothetical protein
LVLDSVPFSFQTQVYDTNVGDISSLASYFNPQRWTVVDLNERFGIQPQNAEPNDSSSSAASTSSMGPEAEAGSSIEGGSKEETLVDDKTGMKIK